MVYGARTANRRRAGIEPYPSGVEAPRGLPATSADISILTDLVTNAPVRTWVDTGIKSRISMWPVRSMISGVKDAEHGWLAKGGIVDTASRQEADGNFYYPAVATLLDSNGWAYLKQAKQIIWGGGGHGSWPGQEFYWACLQTREMARLTDPPAMVRNADGTWRNLDGSLISCHTYGGITAVEDLRKLFIFGGGIWPYGGFNNELYSFDYVNHQWEHLHANPLNTGLKRVPHMHYREADGRLYIGRPRTWRWYDPVARVYGPVFQGAEYGTGMSILAEEAGGIYTFHFPGTTNPLDPPPASNPDRVDFLPFSQVGVSYSTTNLLDSFPTWTAHARWPRVGFHWNSWMWDPLRQMAICWNGGAASSSANPNPTADIGKLMFALDFNNGKFYEIPLSGTHPPGIETWPGPERGWPGAPTIRCLGAFNRFTYIAEWDAYLCSNNSHLNNGLMVVRPGDVSGWTLLAG